MPIAWCPKRRRTVDVKPGDECPVCGTITVGLDFAGVGRVSGQYISFRGFHQVSFAKKLVAKKSVRSATYGTRRADIGRLYLVPSLEQAAVDIGQALQKENVKRGDRITVTGELAKAGRDRVLIVKTISKSVGSLKEKAPASRPRKGGTWSEG